MSNLSVLRIGISNAAHFGMHRAVQQEHKPPIKPNQKLRTPSLNTCNKILTHATHATHATHVTHATHATHSHAKYLATSIAWPPPTPTTVLITPAEEALAAAAISAKLS